MTTPAFDAARNDLVSQRDECERQAEYHRTIAEGCENKHNVLDHQILGMDSAAKLLLAAPSSVIAVDPAPEPPKPARQDVRGAIRGLLARPGNAEGMAFAEITTSLPHLNPASVRAALQAATKAGEFETKNGLFWLPRRSEEITSNASVSQARLDEMRAALKRIGSGVLVETESFILPETIDLAIEQGWARRENGRLYLVEQAKAAE